MAVYYISNNGCDKNNGLTPETAWATIDHANQNISGGDQILLRCGDIFYGKITIPEGTAENPTVISSYGVGERPQICMYKITTSPEIWTEVQPNIWRTSLLDKANYTGNIYTDDTNVGFILADGEIHGFRKFEFPDLSVQWDYLCENKFIYVFSEGNPNSLKREIRFSVNGYVITPMGHNIISNLDLCGSGGHGIAGIYHNVQILNCRIHEVGGSILVGYSNPRTRYGNGIEIWQDTENVTIDNCHIINCYDVAFTMQGYPEKGGWYRVSLKNCVMWGNHQSFEIWSRIKKIDGGMFECEFMNNVCIGAGMGWSDGPRPNKDCGAHLLFYATDCSTHDIKVKNNIFYDSKYALYYKMYGELPSDYDSDENFIYLRPETKLINSPYYYSFDEIEEFKKRSGKEKNSTFRKVTPTDETMEQLAERLKKECFGE